MANQVDEAVAVTSASEAKSEEAPTMTLSAPVVRGSAWLVASVGISAAGGYLFWRLAQGHYPKSAVDQATELFTVVMFANFASSLGLPVAIGRFASGRPDAVRALYRLSLAATAASSAVAGLLFWIAAPEGESEAMWRWGAGGGVALFATFVTGISFAVLVDVRLTAMRLWRWVLVRNATVSLSRIPLLWITPLGESALWLLLLIAGIPALSGLAATAAVQHSTRRSRTPWRPLPSELPAFARFAGVNWAGMLAAQAPQFVLPLVVAATLGTDGDYASFFFAWQITMVVFLVPQAVANLVLVEGSRDPARMRHQLRIGLSLAVAVTAVLSFAAAVGPAASNLLFDAEYQEAAELLPRFLAASVPWSVTAMCLAGVRVAADSKATVAITAAFSVCTLVPAALVSSDGPAAVGWAWLAGNLVAAVVAAAIALRRGVLRARGATPTG